MREFWLFKLLKEIKDAKGNISMHDKTSLTIILSAIWMENIKRQTQWKRGVWKHQSLHSEKSIFSLEVSLCSNIQVFSVGKPSHITSTRGGWDGSVNWLYMLTVNWQKIGFVRLFCQIQGHETWVSKSGCGQS